MLSGKAFVSQAIGGFSIKLDFMAVQDESDLEMLFEMYNRVHEGFLISLSGFDETQFRFRNMPYRNEDIVLVRPINNFSSDWVDNFYKNGATFSLELKEVVR